MVFYRGIHSFILLFHIEPLINPNVPGTEIITSHHLHFSKVSFPLLIALITRLIVLNADSGLSDKLKSKLIVRKYWRPNMKELFVLKIRYYILCPRVWAR